MAMAMAMNDHGGGQPSHPVLATWYAEVEQRAEPGGQELLDRISWALNVGRLTYRSFAAACDRAMTAALAGLGDRTAVEVEILCGEPMLLPAAWPDRYGDVYVTSFWEDPGICWTETDFDLIQVGITTDDGSGVACVGRALAAPEWFGPAQARWYDVLRLDGMTPPRAWARARRYLVGRFWRLHRTVRTLHRRRIRLRYPLPHPALVQWLSVVSAADHPQPLLEHLRWATGRTGCLTEAAYLDAVDRAVHAARSAGARNRQFALGCARPDLIGRRPPWLLAVRASPSDPDFPSLDRVTIYQTSDDQLVASAFALPTALRAQNAGAYEELRQAGVSMADAYRRLAERANGPGAQSREAERQPGRSVGW
jgi:hypothetical protein